MLSRVVLKKENLPWGSHFNRARYPFYEEIMHQSWVNTSMQGIDQKYIAVDISDMTR